MTYPQDDNAPSKRPVAGTNSSGPAMRFSSPMPWLFAIVLSLAIWAGFGWLLWRFFHG